MVLKEIDVLIGLLVHWHLDSKAFRKQAIRMKRFTHPRVRFLDAVIKSKKPHAETYTVLQEIDVVADVMETVKETGGWGIVDVDGIGYPIELNFTAEDPVDVVNDLRWSQENEGQVLTACAHATMSLLNRVTLSCGVTLFCAKGFSGEMSPRAVQVQIRHCPDALKLRGGKQYF